MSKITKFVQEFNDKVTKLQNPKGKHIEHDKWYAEVSYTRRLHSVRRYCRLLANITLYSAAASEVIPDKAFRSGYSGGLAKRHRGYPTLNFFALSHLYKSVSHAWLIVGHIAHNLCWASPVHAKITDAHLNYYFRRFDTPTNFTVFLLIQLCPKYSYSILFSKV